MPPLRKSKRKSMSELLHMRDSPRCQSFLVDVPLPMDGSHIFTSTTKRGNQMTSKSGMLPPRKSKKYRGDEYAKEVQATQQLTTQETSHLGHDAFEDGATRPDVAMHDIPSSTHVSTSLEAAVSQYGSDTIASSPWQPYGASYGTHPVTDQNSCVLQKNVATQLEKTSSLLTQATKSTTPKSLNSKLVSSITAIRNSKRRDSEGNKISHLHAAKKTLQASSLKISHLHAAFPSKPLTEMKSLRPLEKSTATPCKSAKIDHTARVEKTGPSNQSMKRKMNERPFAQQSHDFEPVTIPITTTVHSPSRVVVPPHMEEEALFDSVKDIMKDGPVPPGVSLREHTTPPDGRIYSIRFDSIGKPVGPNAGKFAAKCGVYARMGHLFPLDVMWKKQSSAAKDMALKDLSKMFQSVFDLDFSHSALTTIRDRLREWRYKVKKTYYEPYATDEERIANRHPRVEEGQWIRLLALWSTKAKMIESKRNKSNKAKQVITHTLGRQSFSVLRDKMVRSGEGDVLFSVAFVQGHKKANGSYHNKETKDLMERIMSTSQPTSSSSTYIESSLYDIYRLQEIIRDETGKEDHGGYCRGLGSGVTRRRLSHPFGTFQTLTQSHINQMREDVNHAREDVDHFKEDAKRAWEEVKQERIKTARAEANAKAANERFEAVEEVQRSTFQMLLDLQRQFGELQRRI